eukprot:1184959-Pleurochrysis_carterae.AAC.2
MVLLAIETLLARPARPSATAQGTTCTDATTPASRTRSTAARRALWGCGPARAGERRACLLAKARLQRDRWVEEAKEDLEIECNREHYADELFPGPPPTHSDDEELSRRHVRVRVG